MNLQLKIEDNSGTIVLNRDFQNQDENTDVYIESSYIYCSNSFASNHECHISLDFDIDKLHNTKRSFSYSLYPENVASNVLKTTNRIYLGKLLSNFKRNIVYSIYDYNFSLLTGNIVLVIHLSLQ